MVSMTLGTADGVPGAWAIKEDAASVPMLMFLRSTSGEPVVELELDPKNVIATIPDAKDPASHVICCMKSIAVEEGQPVPVPSLQTISAKGLPLDFVSRFGIDRANSDLLAVKGPLTVLVSTESGTKQAVAFNEQLIKPFLDVLGLTSTTSFTTTSRDSISDYTRSNILPVASSGQKQIVILLSGDGGNIDLLNTLLSCDRSSSFSKPLIYSLPLGTGNALSNSYLYNSDNTHGLSTLARGHRRPLPSFRATFSPSARLITDEGRHRGPLAEMAGIPTLFGAVVCSWGLHATLVADSDTAHYRQFGAARFGMVAKELLFPSEGDHHVYKGKVSIKDPYSSQWEEVSTEEHSYVLATLVSHLEQTFNVSPDSSTLDGMMRLIRMAKMSGKELMGVMEGGYKDGAHVGMDGVHYREVSGIRIEVGESDEKWRRICIDGKIVGLEEGGWVQVEKEPEAVVEIGCLR